MSGPVVTAYNSSGLGGFELNYLAINAISGTAELRVELIGDGETYDVTLTARLRPKEKLRGAERPPYPGREKWRKIVPVGTRVK